MLVDQLYIDVPTGAEYFLRDKTTCLTKLEGSPLKIKTDTKHITFQKHSLVLVESDVILITKEEFFKKFPKLRNNHAL